jgi:hypothetical protein
LHRAAPQNAFTPAVASVTRPDESVAR